MGNYPNRAATREEKPFLFSLFYCCGWLNVFFALTVGDFFLILQFLNSLRFPAVTIGGKTSHNFWAHYSLSLSRRDIATQGNLSCSALKRVLKIPKIRQIIAPHEGKAIEKNIRFVAEEFDINNLAYSPHPQSKLNLAILNTPNSSCPKS